MSKVTLALLGIAAVSAGIAGVAGVRAAETRALARWEANPDPTADERTALVGEDTMLPTGDGGSLHVVSVGQGPVVVLAHGITANVDDWAPVARRLAAAGLRVVAYDERGHGQSLAGADGCTLATLGSDLLDVLGAFAPRDAVLVGHSMGGIAILSALDQAPDVINQCRGVVLVATVARAPDTRASRLQARIVSSELPPRLMRNERHGRVLARSGYGRTPSLSMLDGTRRNWIATPTPTRAGFIRAMRGFDLLDSVGRLTCPAVVVCGDLDRLTPVADNEAIAARLPHGTIDVVPGAGHVIIKEQPARVAEHVVRLAGQTASEPTASAWATTT
jgi:pimeloyl-ACP methyl ester carboxylesterase